MAGSALSATQPATPSPRLSSTVPDRLVNGGVAPMRTSRCRASSSTWTKQTSEAVASVTRTATCSATSRRLRSDEVTSMIRRRSRFSPRRYGPSARGSAGALSARPLMEDALPQRHGDGLRTIAHVELAVDRAAVGLDRLLADVELLADGPVGQPPHHQLEHLALPLRQAQVGAGPELAALQPGGGDGHPAGDGGVDRDLAAHHPLDVVGQLGGGRPLEQEPRRADPQGLEEVLLVVVDGEEHDLDPLVAAGDLLAQVEAA